MNMAYTTFCMNIRILPTMISDIPLLLGSGTRLVFMWPFGRLILLKAADPKGDGCFDKLGLLFVTVLELRALLFGVCITGPPQTRANYAHSFQILT